MHRRSVPRTLLLARPDNKKHYRLDTSVLTKLVDYAEEGHTLRTHQDVPP